MSAQNKTKRQDDQVAVQRRSHAIVRLEELRGVDESMLPTKVGRLFFVYVSGTRLANLGYRAIDIAEYLEARGYLELSLLDGNLHYKWLKKPLSRSEFFELVLGPAKE